MRHLRLVAVLLPAPILLACATTGGGEAGVLAGTGAREILVASNGTSTQVTVEVDLDSGHTRWALIDPDDKRTDIVDLEGDDSVLRVIDLRGRPGNWRLSISLTDADGRYALEWKS